MILYSHVEFQYCCVWNHVYWATAMNETRVNCDAIDLAVQIIELTGEIRQRSNGIAAKMMLASGMSGFASAYNGEISTAFASPSQCAVG